MIDFLILIRSVLASLFKSRTRLEVEILILRQQLSVLRRKAPKRPRLTNFDRVAFVWLYRLCPAVIDAVTIIRPETLLRWHRVGFRLYWRWKSRPLGGRLPVCKDVRDLIRKMSVANPLWGAPRIHGELLKLGFEISQTTVAKYMPRHRRPPSQGWKTFLRNHADGIASIYLVIVPTIGFQLLYGLVILQHGRRQVLTINVTGHPTAEWIARQITDAFAWDNAPRYLIRDRDGAYGGTFIERLRAMGIRDHPVAPRSPWQNGYVERLIGSIRRECLDHVVVLGERHLRRILKSYAIYYNEVRTHLSLAKDAPRPRAIQRIGRIVSLPVLAGLHHNYVRV